MIDILIYLAIGFIWTEWLEWFCMNNFENKLGEPFTTREKVTQFLLWPVFLSVFIYNFFADLFNRQ